LQIRRHGEIVCELVADSLDTRAAAHGLDRARAPEIGKRPGLIQTKNQRAHASEVVSERILGIGPTRAISKDRGSRGNPNAEFRKIGVKNLAGSRCDGGVSRSACLGPLNEKRVSMTVFGILTRPMWLSQPLCHDVGRVFCDTGVPFIRFGFLPVGREKADVPVGGNLDTLDFQTRCRHRLDRAGRFALLPAVGVPVASWHVRFLYSVSAPLFSMD